MAEAHARADLDQACCLGRCRRLEPDAEPLGRAPQQRHVADRLRRRQQQQPPGICRERLELPHEALLDAAGQRCLQQQPEPARYRDRRPLAGQLQQRERIAAGNPAYGISELRNDLERFVFLLGGSDDDPLFGQ